MGYTLDIHKCEEPAMVTKVQKWGNSQGLRVTKEILDEAQIDLGDEVKVSVRGGKIIVEPVVKVRGRHSIKALVSRIPPGYRAEEADWGRSVGKEAW
jgi:antitoxin MazE